MILLWLISELANVDASMQVWVLGRQKKITFWISNKKIWGTLNLFEQ